MSTPDPNIRMSDAEREAVIGRLHAATQEGRLGLDEFAERSRQVYEARTFAEVQRLLADLPDDPGALAIVNAPKDAAAPQLRLTPAHSHAKRQGPWTVPQRIFVAPRHGSVRLDCREARFAGREIEVEMNLVHSSLVIILPRGASAVDDGVELHGGRVNNGCHDEGGPKIRLSGRTRYGSATVRYERRFLWWRW
ncbi:DUF1707 domain-containing protein [Glycomyces sp. A-F 0318]|uniref:DUF1707 SHOCT-like domain-containing protein n=1 Tax=Glycomyces amatae TaxID=2881355 RepID=UPI001E4CCF6C|nr:DUF1707 domain-containing protein [Glycomyces amatae]MCD0445445.1 DUF1707 domain-containing protein [Glycomyces amatae]